MDAHFEEMLRRLKLTKSQREDARTKYHGVAKTLHKEFYETEYDGSTKLLIGSYGKKTNIRPPTDVDLLFKIPAETFDQYYNYNGNGASALLQDIRTKLSKTYPTAEKISAWGKVVLVQFSEGKHNVELLPAFEVDGGVFMIPNTEDGGSWESFDARADLAAVDSADAETGGKARKLVRIVKRWRKKTASLTLKSYDIEQYCLSFLKTNSVDNKTWSATVLEFFTWLAADSSKDISQIQTALSRATKAFEYEQNEQFVEACNEWRKVFGNRTFPAYSKSLSQVYRLAANDISEKEEYIEDLYPVRIDPRHALSVTATVTGRGFRSHSLHAFLQKYLRLPKQLDIIFTANNVPSDSKLFWKIRNFGTAAREAGDLRGEIHEGVGTQRKESSKYLGTHYAECYAVQNGVCVARALQFVPIGED